MTLEASIVRRILKALNALDGCRALKVHGSAYSRGGTPDITGAIFGQRFDIEVKRPGKKPTPRQLSEMRKWKAAGSLVGVATSVEEALEIINQTEPQETT